MSEDKILQKALRQRESLRKQLTEIEGFIRTFKRLAAGDENLAAGLVPPPSPAVKNYLREFANSAVAKSSPIALIEVSVRNFLTHIGRPASTIEIIDRIAPDEVKIGGKQPRWNLSAKLSRMPDIISIEGHGWWFKDRPCEAVGYVPPPKTEGPDEDQSSGPSNESGKLPLNR